MQKHEHDEDIFTLQEDDANNRRSQILQYSLVSVFAVAVLAVALYMSFWLTNNRIEYQTRIAEQAEQEEAVLENTTEDRNFWPETEFPGIPKLESSTYETKLFQKRAEVHVPMAVASKFSEYAETLADAGGKVYVQTPRLTIVVLGTTEIHLESTTGRNVVTLCSESAIDWNEADYQLFPRLKSGRLVDASEGTGERSRVLTYRLVSPAEAIAYCSELVSANWQLSSKLEPKDQVFQCTLKKDDMQISVDYYSSSDNFRVRYAYMDPEPAPTDESEVLE